MQVSERKGRSLLSWRKNEKWEVFQGGRREEEEENGKKKEPRDKLFYFVKKMKSSCFFNLIVSK